MSNVTKLASEETTWLLTVSVNTVSRRHAAGADRLCDAVYTWRWEGQCVDDRQHAEL